MNKFKAWLGSKNLANRFSNVLICFLVFSFSLAIVRESEGYPLRNPIRFNLNLVDIQGNNISENGFSLFIYKSTDSSRVLYFSDINDIPDVVDLENGTYHAEVLKITSLENATNVYAGRSSNFSVNDTTKAINVTIEIITESSWPFKNVMDFAGEDSVLSDNEMQEAVKQARSHYGTLVFPPGDYYFSSSFDLSIYVDSLPGDKYPSCNIKGAHARNTRIFFTNPDSTAYLFKAGVSSGKKTRVKIEDITISRQTPDLFGKGVAIRLDRSICSVIDNVTINNFDIGILLSNYDSPSVPGHPVYNEVNTISRALINDCNIAIYQHFDGYIGPRNVPGIKDTNDQSFHGNIFDPVFINLKSGQVGFRNDGFYYNGRFNFFMWAKGSKQNPSILILNERYSVNNIGNITWEGKYARLEGKKKFEFKGDITIPVDFKAKLIDNTGGKIIYDSQRKASYFANGTFGDRIKQTNFPAYRSGFPNGYAEKLISLPPNFKSGLYIITAEGDPGPDAYSLVTAKILIPKDKSTTRPIIYDLKGYNYNNEGPKFKIEVLPVGNVNTTNHDNGEQGDFLIRYWCTVPDNELINPSKDLKWKVVRVDRDL